MKLTEPILLMTNKDAQLDFPEEWNPMIYIPPGYICDIR